MPDRLAQLHDLQRWDELAAEASHRLAADPEDGDALAALVSAHLGLRRFADAYAAAQRLVAVRPHDARSLCAASLAASKEAYRTQAITLAREAVRRAPELWETHQRLAAALSDADPTDDEAPRSAAEAIRLAPEEPAVHFTAGYIAQKRGDKEAARAAYAEVLRRDPEHAGAHNNLGVLTRDARGAAQAYVTALRINPDDRLYLSNLPMALLSLLKQLEWTALGFLAVACLLDWTPWHGPSVWSIAVAALMVVTVTVMVVRVLRVLPWAAWRHSLSDFRRRDPVVDRLRTAILAALAVLASTLLPWASTIGVLITIIGFLVFVIINGERYRRPARRRLF